jgi:hypothetical protein
VPLCATATLAEFPGPFGHAETVVAFVVSGSHAEKDG